MPKIPTIPPQKSFGFPPVSCEGPEYRVIPWSAAWAVNLMLQGLRSIVDVDFRRGIRSFHASFLDFLFDPARAKSYHVDIEEWHASNFHRIFSLVNSSVAGLKNPKQVGIDCSKILQNWCIGQISHPTRYNPQQIETYIVQCSRQIKIVQVCRQFT